MNAFFIIPLTKDERKYFVAKVGDLYVVFCVLVQGSCNGPCIWGRMGAMAGGLGQSLFDLAELHLHIYVDDPLAILKGTFSRRCWLRAQLMIAWLAFGIPLSFGKADWGAQVVWIGVSFSISAWILMVSLKTEFLQELRGDIQQLRRLSVVSLEQLCSLAGRCSRVASLIKMWRPFLNELCAAISET